MLCAAAVDGGKDACSADSGRKCSRAVLIDFFLGGPLTFEDPSTGKYELIGVVSWGVKCADDDYPGVYSRVSKQLEWISRTTRRETELCPR